jgi:hypothetical protein
LHLLHFLDDPPSKWFLLDSSDETANREQFHVVPLYESRSDRFTYVGEQWWTTPNAALEFESFWATVDFWQVSYLQFVRH